MSNKNIQIVSYDLGGNNSLKAISLIKDIAPKDLEEMLLNLDGKRKVANLRELSERNIKKDEIDSFDELDITVLEEEYKVPEKLLPYRFALEKPFSEKGMTNGKVIIPHHGVLEIPLTTIIGGYFDFKATQLLAVPGDILPDMYAPGKTIKDLLPELGIKISDLARNITILHALYTSGGEEISFVQRAKNLGIAADCMSFSGSTPNFTENMRDKKYNFGKFFNSRIAIELKEEYLMEYGEFHVNKIHFIDDTLEVPFMAVEIVTKLSLKELAERNYGRAGAKKEHLALYSLPNNKQSINELVKRFPLFNSMAYLIGNGVITVN